MGERAGGNTSGCVGGGVWEHGVRKGGGHTGQEASGLKGKWTERERIGVRGKCPGNGET